MKYYVVLDLEMCNGVEILDEAQHYKGRNEIIQIGAVLMDENLTILDSFNRFVRPEYGKLDEFITELTGITEEDLRGAALLADVLEQFVAWIPEGDVKMVSWSKSDQKQFKRELRYKGIQNDRMKVLLRHWLDSQKLFADKAPYTKTWSLSNALQMCGITFEGREHNGYDDAYNTAILFTKLMQENTLQMDEDSVESITHISRKPLSNSLGDILAGLDLSGIKEE